MLCLDQEGFGRLIELFGSNDSDVTQWLELILLPCMEDAPGCRVKDFRKEEDGLMDVNALWDEIGLPVLEVISKESRVE